MPSQVPPFSLRATLEAANGQIWELEDRATAQAFDALGLDPTEGVGKAVAVTFDGEPEQLAEFGYAPEFTHPHAQAITGGQAELDQLTNTGGSVAPLSQANEIARAEARGDSGTSIALKSDQLARILGR